MLPYMLIFAASFLTTYITAPWIIPKLRKAGFTGKDINKKDKPVLPEMGGFVIIFGLSAGVLISIFMSSFGESLIPKLQLELILAALATILIMTIVGIFDDLFSMRQSLKALLPVFAALPLMAVQAGDSTMNIPFIGPVDLGIWYALILIPIGITGASNITNMLAGFNGLEAGMGSVASISLAFIAFELVSLDRPGSLEAFILLLSMSGALLAFLRYNWYPARLFMGDIGTLSIGAVIASAVIIGNFEILGAFVMVLYIGDFFIKLVNRFPSKGWGGEIYNGKLFCRKKPISLCQRIMAIHKKGVTEKKLVITLIILQLIVGAIAIAIFEFSVLGFILG